MAAAYVHNTTHCPHTDSTTMRTRQGVDAANAKAITKESFTNDEATSVDADLDDQLENQPACTPIPKRAFKQMLRSRFPTVSTQR